jgi:hypothetical protein
LFNFLHQTGCINESELDQDQDIIEDVGDIAPLRELPQSQGTKAMNQFREKIAGEMWEAYYTIHILAAKNNRTFIQTEF